MNQDISENPYKAIPDQAEETTKATGENPVVRVVGLAILGPLVMLFVLSFLSTVEIERFSWADMEGVVLTTIIAVVITSATLPVIWAVAGFIGRRRNMPEMAQQESVFFVLKWAVACVLFVATIPSIIEGFSSTYPVSEYTVNYFVLLALSMIFVLAANFLQYRRMPTRKSAFVCCLGGVMVLMAVGVLGLFFVAIAGSALT